MSHRKNEVTVTTTFRELVNGEKMTLVDDVKAFLETFEHAAKVCGWPPAQWAVHWA